MSERTTYLMKTWRARALAAEVKLDEVRSAIKGRCPTCNGPNRETVDMVCQTCGTDYGRRT